ncbi:MAG: Grx4 family monothiol glutaredoxin [Sphingomonadales bacterium]|jgi:monothiol glutaredoxin
MTNPTHERIQKEVGESDVVLFMKGTPLFPQCGFSAAVVDVLERVGIEYASHDVLQDPELRQGIKEFSNWPTIPQVYVKGEFIGGCDIVREMFASGELESFLNDKGVKKPAS